MIKASQAAQAKKSLPYSQTIRKIVQTALLISLAIVARNLSVMVNIMGASGMRVGFSQVFSRMPAFLFGPVFGGIATGIVDILGYLIRPEGAFIPLLTLTQVLDGVIIGLVFKGIKNIDIKKLRSTMWISFTTIGALGLMNIAISRFLSESSIAIGLNSLGAKKDYLLRGLVAISVIALLLLTLNHIIRKKFPEASIHKYYLKILLAFGMAGIPITILNTYILINFIPQLNNIAFTIFLIPRLIEEILMTVILSYIMSFLMSVYDKLIKKPNAE